VSVASFNNIIVHYSDGSQKESNVNDLLMEQSNQFMGWECWAGLQNITIDNQGKVWRAICRQGDCLGSIFEDFELPVDTVICGKQVCNCAADIQITKAKPEYISQVRAKKP
jgi:hypothetical protein